MSKKTTIILKRRPIKFVKVERDLGLQPMEGVRYSIRVSKIDRSWFNVLCHFFLWYLTPFLFIISKLTKRQVLIGFEKFKETEQKSVVIKPKTIKMYSKKRK